MKVNFQLLCDMNGESEIINYPITMITTYDSVNLFIKHLENIATEILKEHTVVYSLKCNTNFRGKDVCLIAKA